MILQPRLAFVPKNLSHSFCPKPIKIPNLPDNEKLCPVITMKTFLRKCNDLARSENANRPDFIWMNNNFNLLSTMKIRKLFQKVIYSADPNAFIRTTNVHSIRAVAASTLELKGLNLLEISSSMNWKSSSTFVNFYSRPTLNNIISAVVTGQRFWNKAKTSLHNNFQVRTFFCASRLIVDILITTYKLGVIGVKMVN